MPVKDWDFYVMYLYTGVRLCSNSKDRNNRYAAQSSGAGELVGMTSAKQIGSLNR